MLAECPEVNWARLVASLPAARDRDGEVAVLLDADRTLGPLDTSRLFLERAGLPLAPIKETFERLGYSYPAFRAHAAAYLAVGEADFERHCAAVAEQGALYPGAADFLRRPAARAAVYVVTAGIAPIWTRMLARAGLGAIPVIGGACPGARYVVGRDEKGRLCAHLQAAGRRVMAFGDSDVDSLMLRAADRAVVVVNHRNNADLLPQLAGHPALYQIAPGADAHPGLRRIDYATADELL